MPTNRSSKPENLEVEDEELELIVEIPTVRVGFSKAIKGTMILPSLDYAPTGLGLVSPEDRGAALYEWLLDCGRLKEALILKKLPNKFFEEFQDTWAKASKVSLPKSAG